MEAGAAVAELESATALVQVLANGTGVLRKKVAQPGGGIADRRCAGVVEADGEAVPYDRPHSLADISLVAG